MKTINLYLGYEGYSELVLREKTTNNQIIFEVRMLDFHFNEVLSLIQLGQYHTESVMYNYFTCEGWHNGEWECKRVQEFYNQLLSINNLPNEAVLSDALEALKQICNSTLQNGNRLFIEYL